MSGSIGSVSPFERPIEGVVPNEQPMIVRVPHVCTLSKN